MLLSIVLLWPAYLNGGPFWFPDTSTYIRGADAATVWLTGSPSEWSDRLAIEPAEPVVADEADTTAQNEASATGSAKSRVVPTQPVISGRSIYYGFQLYLPMRFLGPWAAVILQSLIVAGLLVFALHLLFRETGALEKRGLFFGSLVLLALVTPLPYYTAMLMPDVYSGIIVLLLGVLLVFWLRLSTGEKAVLLIASGILATFHTTLLLLTVTTGLLAAIIHWPLRSAWKPLLRAAPVLIIAVLAGTMFDWGIEKALDRKPVSPPFLSARLVADGSGSAYLRKTCSQDADRWALCAHLDKLPLESDEMLWDERPGKAVFWTAQLAEQQRLSAEDKPFFLHVLADDPFGVIGDAIRGTAILIGSYDLVAFNYPDFHINEISEKYPSDIGEGIRSTLAAKKAMPVAFIGWSTLAVVLVSFGLMAAICYRVWQGRETIARGAWQITILLLGGWLANAVICGALSSPTDRYQMRLAILVPLAAVTLVAARQRKPATINGALTA